MEDVREIVAWLEATGTEKTRASMTRYNIPNDHAFGVPMAALKAKGEAIGVSHELALALWDSGSYEARTLAAFVDDPAAVTGGQMDRWAAEFDSWAICDTVCFHLFDKTGHAWAKVREWETSEREFVRRAAYALLWALSVHDKQAGDEQFVEALRMLEAAAPDDRPLVLKAMDMALRAVGKRNAALRVSAIEVARALSHSEDTHRAWVGRHSLRELTR